MSAVYRVKSKIPNPKSEIIVVPRFVILIHDYPVVHWDFMLEKEAVLRTWRLEREPLEPRPIVAEALPDHRLAYLDYEGQVSGNRGSVRRFDRGEYALLEESSERVVVKLMGAALVGTAVLEQIANSEGWWFAFTPLESRL
jgi:hypothetical protein